MISTTDFHLSLKERCLYSEGQHVLLAVSGGVDSVVLAHLFFIHNIPFAIAHVNYGLRDDESDADEKFVAELAAKYNVPFFLKKCSPEEINKTEHSIQQVARALRYEFFEWAMKSNGYELLATAHQLNDSMETVLLNLFRGSGLTGLTGIPSRRNNIIRPLIHFSREEVLQYASRNELIWREDTSNADTDYTRNKFRHLILPQVLKEIPQGVAGFEASMRKLTWMEILLNNVLQEWVRAFVVKVNEYENKIAIPSLNKHNLTLLEYYLATLGFNESQLEILSTLHENKEPWKQAGASHVLVRDRDHLFIQKLKKEWSEPPNLIIRECGPLTEFPKEKNEAVIDAEKIKDQLRVRPWHHGEKMIPFGMSGAKLVSDILNEMKIPVHKKESTMVVATESEIVWIPGYRIADKFRVNEKTTQCLHLKFRI